MSRSVACASLLWALCLSQNAYAFAPAPYDADNADVRPPPHLALGLNGRVWRGSEGGMARAHSLGSGCCGPVCGATKAIRAPCERCRITSQKPLAILTWN